MEILSYDITGSTGPKDFEIYYSTDEAVRYNPIDLANQFASVAINVKSTFTIPLADFNISVKEPGLK